MEVAKLFRMDTCSKVLELAIQLNVVDYFKLGVEDDLKFRLGMAQASQLMAKVDCFMKNVRLNQFIKNKNIKKAARKQLYERTRLLVIPFVFFKLDEGYSRSFMTEFIFQTTANNAIVNDYIKVFRVLHERKPADSGDFGSVMESIIDETNFDDYRFQLNLIYYANVLDALDVVDFIDYYTVKGKDHYYDYMANLLNL